eukprot:5152675-Pyramimonas_sp.AAC.1
MPPAAARQVSLAPGFGDRPRSEPDEREGRRPRRRVGFGHAPVWAPLGGPGAAAGLQVRGGPRDPELAGGVGPEVRDPGPWGGIG